MPNRKYLPAAIKKPKFSTKSTVACKKGNTYLSRCMEKQKNRNFSEHRRCSLPRNGYNENTQWGHNNYIETYCGYILHQKNESSGPICSNLLFPAKIPQMVEKIIFLGHGDVRHQCIYNVQNNKRKEQRKAT